MQNKIQTETQKLIDRARRFAVRVHGIVRRMPCFFGNHRYEVTQRLTRHSRRIACRRCGGVWGMHDDVRAVIEWDAELADYYRVVGVEVKYQPWEGKMPNAAHDGRQGEAL